MPDRISIDRAIAGRGADRCVEGVGHAPVIERRPPDVQCPETTMAAWRSSERRAAVFTFSSLRRRVTKSAVRTDLLKNVSRIVVKLGTGVLTDSRKQPDLAQIRQLVAQMAEQRKAGREVVLVTSGAVGAGMGVLGYDKRPGSLDELQACAAVGQSRLMATYEKLFAKFGLHVGQVLLTHDDLEHHERHISARQTLVTLLRRGVVPIINENDAVSITELKFGDNDKLSALVASLLPADLLVIVADGGDRFG